MHFIKLKCYKSLGAGTCMHLCIGEVMKYALFFKFLFLNLNQALIICIQRRVSYSRIPLWKSVALSHDTIRFMRYLKPQKWH